MNWDELKDKRDLWLINAADELQAIAAQAAGIRYRVNELVAKAAERDDAGEHLTTSERIEMNRQAATAQHLWEIECALNEIREQVLKP